MTGNINYLISSFCKFKFPFKLNSILSDCKIRSVNAAHYTFMQIVTCLFSKSLKYFGKGITNV